MAAHVANCLKLKSRIRYELCDWQVEFLRHLATGASNSIRYDAEGLARTHEAFGLWFGKWVNEALAI